MTLKVGIPIEALDEETREKLGIKLPPTVGQLGSSLVRVGNVLKALKGLSYEAALRVLWHAERLLVAQESPATQEGEPEPYLPTITWTLQVVSRVFDIDITLMKQHRRELEIVRARQVAMYILVMTNGYTYTEIGQALGKRTPATISHGFQQIAKQLDKDTNLKEKVGEILMRLTGEEH